MLLEVKLRDADKDRSKTPRLANPEDAALLRALFDLDGIWAMGGKDFAAISQRCDPVRQIGRHYAALATNPARPGTLEYEDEVALAAAAYLLCKGREADAIARFVATLPESQHTPERRDDAKDGGEKTIGLVAATIRDATGPWYTSAPNRELILDALAKAAPFLAATMSLDQRKGVLDAIDRQSGAIPAQDRSRVATIRRAFEDTRCGAMCTEAS